MKVIAIGKNPLGVDGTDHYAEVQLEEHELAQCKPHLKSGLAWRTRKLATQLLTEQAAAGAHLNSRGSFLQRVALAEHPLPDLGRFMAVIQVRYDN